MKTFTLLTGLLLGLTWQIKAQACRQINIQDSVQRRLLNTYIEESVRKRCFINDKGVIVVTRFTDENGRPNWGLVTVLDDRYKENPPVEWAQLDGDIILFYDGKASQFDVVKHAPTPELLRCLDEAIGDRLYIRPPKRLRVGEMDGPNGKVRRIYQGRAMGGNVSNGMRIVFEADGTITKFVSV